MKNNSGFTLVEVLAVLVLIALVAGIGIPNVIKIVENKSNTEYKSQMKLVDKAVDLYTLRYQKDFKEFYDSNCFLLDYQLLLDEELIEEDEVKCTGTIKLTRKNNNGFKKDNYLECKNKKNTVLVSNTLTNASGCVDLRADLNKDYSSIPAPTISEGNKNWTNSNVVISITKSGIDASNVLRYEYHIDTNSKTPARNASVSGTGNSYTVTGNGTTYVWARVIDKTGKISDWSNRTVANIDKDPLNPPTITASDGVTSGNIHSGQFVLTFSGANRVSGNNYYYGNSSSDLKYFGSTVKITGGNQIIYVKLCNGVNICSGISSYNVRFN